MQLKPTSLKVTEEKCGSIVLYFLWPKTHGCRSGKWQFSIIEGKDDDLGVRVCTVCIDDETMRLIGQPSEKHVR